MAWAHGLGVHYTLPLPLWLYLIGMAALVALAFVTIGVFGREARTRPDYPRVNLLRCAVGRLLAHPVLLFGLQCLSVALWVLVIMAGLLGQPNPARNLAPTFVWSVGWVGLAYLCALVGNIWAVVNPWHVLFAWAEALYGRLARGRRLSRQWPYPRALGAWPGVLLLLVLAWIELALQGAAVPARLTGIVLGYTALTWTGMFLFGMHVWLRYGEVFSMVFGLLARFAPTEVRVCAPHLCQTCALPCRDRDGACIDCYACFARADASQRQWNLRPYAVGLARHTDVSLADMALVLVLLATAIFDGVLATPLWTDIEHTIRGALPEWGGVRRVLPRTLGLLGCVLLVLEVYVVCSVVMAHAGGRRCSGVTLARQCVHTLVPIAIAYHVAHYLPVLLLQGQALLPLLSDPFGFGWNLLGTAAYQIRPDLVGGPFAWYTLLLALGTGHSAAVFLGHRTTLQTMRQPAAARRSQYPLLVLLLGSAVLSLWLLAQPVIGADEERVPSPPPRRGPCQGFVVLPNGYAVLSGPDTPLAPSQGGKHHLLGYRHGQAVTPRPGMLCVPLRDSNTTAWAAIGREAGWRVTVNSLSGPLTADADQRAALEITVLDSRQGAAVDDATVRLLARMPQHDQHTPGGHGLVNDPYLRGLVATPMGRGRYTIAGLAFGMPGPWLVAIQVQEGRQTQQVYFAPVVGE